MHPLTPNLTELSDNDLQKKITDLTNRLNQAHRFGQAGLVGQVQMMLEDYGSEASRRQRIMMEELMSKNDKFNGIIDIQ
jgi:hypothetical protein